MADLHKTEIAQLVAKKLKAHPSDGSRALTAVLDALSGAFNKRDGVIVTGFGSFQLRQVLCPS